MEDIKTFKNNIKIRCFYALWPLLTVPALVLLNPLADRLVVTGGAIMVSLLLYMGTDITYKVSSEFIAFRAGFRSFEYFKDDGHFKPQTVGGLKALLLAAGPKAFMLEFTRHKDGALIKIPVAVPEKDFVKIKKIMEL